MKPRASGDADASARSESFLAFHHRLAFEGTWLALDAAITIGEERRRWRTNVRCRARDAHPPRTGSLFVAAVLDVGAAILAMQGAPADEQPGPAQPDIETALASTFDALRGLGVIYPRPAHRPQRPWLRTIQEALRFHGGRVEIFTSSEVAEHDLDGSDLLRPPWRSRTDLSRISRARARAGVPDQRRGQLRQRSRRGPPTIERDAARGVAQAAPTSKASMTTKSPLVTCRSDTATPAVAAPWAHLDVAPHHRLAKRLLAARARPTPPFLVDGSPVTASSAARLSVSPPLRRLTAELAAAGVAIPAELVAP